VDSESLQQVKNEYYKWIAEQNWNWFTTLKIESGRPSKRRALELCDQWLEEIAKADGSSWFRWVRVLEKGESGNHFHFHLLVGGFRNRMATWGRRWEQLGGEALIEKFNSDEGGIRYLLKTMKQNGELDIDFHLPNR